MTNFTLKFKTQQMLHIFLFAFSHHSGGTKKKYIYILFDGLTYKMSGYNFCELRSTSNEQNVRTYYMLGH